MAENIQLEKTYDPQNVESGIYALWERIGAFRSQPDGSPHNRTFTIVIPPPNVTGALHLGHALNNTLQDILVRYHRMRGFNTLWQPGTDHAGIATQAVVERRIREQDGKTRHEIGREALVERIWKWKDEYEKRILNQLKLMGCSCDWGYRPVHNDNETQFECDWSRTSFTLDDGLSKAVRHMFFRLFKDGLIFRGKRLVNWDTQLQTAVSDDEVYHETVKGHFWHFKYPVIDPKPGEPEFVMIATTRPETMLGDTAVAVHPDPEGFFDEQEAELKELSEASSKEAASAGEKLKALRERRDSHLPELIKLRNMARDGRKVMLPLVEREMPLIEDEWADPTKGSGCVKITPAHDPNDYEVGLRHSLPMINVLTADGKVGRIVESDGSENAYSKTYEGLPFSKEGRAKVVADLEALDLLHDTEDREIELGHSDRSKHPVEPFLSDQWFVRTGDISEPRTSVRADSQPQEGSRNSVRVSRRTPDLSQGAVLITWTTYGTWLPGDERGFVSRVPDDRHGHTLRNLPGEPYVADQPDLRAAAHERMEGDPVYLKELHARCLLRSIAASTESHGMEPLAVAIMRNHTHVLVQVDRPKRDILKLLKGAASRELNREFPDAKQAQKRWWTKSGSVRYIKARADLTAAIEYVKHQEHPLVAWSFDMDEGGVVAEFEQARMGIGRDVGDRETARTEVRGSLTLGDGSTASGLAQAAMDAVTDGRIQVFPPRYGKSYLDWLGEKRDWCISRQLWWGHQIPVWTPTRAPAYWEIEGDPLELLSRWKTGGRVAEYRRSKADYGARGFAELLDGAELTQYCVKDKDDIEVVEALEKSGCERDSDVLDTWFSSALWPFSTLGWPDETEHVKQYYPGSVLCTSRDIITNWVARMVMFGLYGVGKIPFDHVYIHPKILDGRGETMSKSKGNGVDPVDVIHTHGADALRYSMADMCTETQDIRMPVEYVCPHCEKLVDQVLAIKNEEQARKSRGEKLGRKLQPADCKRIKCVNKECGKEFATQWADEATKKELSLGRETSDKFDIGRNFCNKLWNAARFAFLNLEGAPCSKLDLASLHPEDRWILASLSQTIRRVHACWQAYQFSAAVRELRDFFWDALCDWYIELTKPRLSPSEPQTSVRADSQPHDERQTSVRAETGTANESCNTAKQVLAFCLDQTLRLWHPVLPFMTERLWQQLGAIAPQRGLPGLADLKTDTHLILAPFPPEDGYPKLDDENIVKVFGEIQSVVRAVRELRAQCSVSPKESVKLTVALPQEQCEAFKANSHIVERMANVSDLVVDPGAKRPPNAGSVTMGSLRVFVRDISDDEAERSRTTKALEALQKQIAGKEKKLLNEKFVNNAKPEVVEAERQRLAELTEQRMGLEKHLAELAD